MNSLDSSAPGKLILSGEYAVLCGAPAISIALDRRAEVKIIERNDSTHMVSTSGYYHGNWRYHCDENGNIKWLDDLPYENFFALFECIWKRLSFNPRTGLHITLNTNQFFEKISGSKYGLGSSAALAVALSGALLSLKKSSTSVISLAHESHNSFQHGVGSGADIITAKQGGVIEFRDMNNFFNLEWPTGLLYKLIWSGKESNTIDKLHKFLRKEKHKSFNHLKNASQQVLNFWKRNDLVSLLNMLNIYVDALQDFNSHYKIGVFDSGHQELTDMTKNIENIIYKPCGAGGGDIGIVLSNSIERIDNFVKKAEKLGFISLNALIDPQGLFLRDNDND